MSGLVKYGTTVGGNTISYLEGDGSMCFKEGNKISVITAQTFHSYWRNPDKENLAEGYIRDDGQSVELVKLFEKYCSKEDEIFEPGCNVGRNLHYLYKAGFTNLRGLDINQVALNRGTEVFPDTVAKIPRACSSIEDYLVKYSTNEVDVVFTMGFLMHIHTSSFWVLLFCMNMARRFIITVEDERSLHLRVIPRNYKEVFEGMGMKQLEEKFVEIPNIVDGEGVVGLTYRVFKK